jgi:sugar O-acyltransferase (sialic acid O-acetyltransferase NeuD family)
VARPVRVVLLGCGGFGRELFQWILDLNEAGGAMEVVGFLDDQATETRIPGVEVLGPLHLARELPGTRFALAINGPATRERIVTALDLPREAWVDVVHPTAIRGQRCATGVGLVLCPWASLSVDILLGDHVHCNTRSGVGHDAVLGDYCSLGPNAIVLGGAELGRRVYLGANSAVLPGSRIGDDVTLGAVSTAMRRVREGSTLAGSPGRRM